MAFSLRKKGKSKKGGRKEERKKGRKEEKRKERKLIVLGHCQIIMK